MTRALPIVLAIALACGCGRGTDTVKTAPVPSDPSSLANVSAFVTTNLVLDLAADFGTKTLQGTVELALDRRDPAAAELVLDTRDLTTRKVEAAIGDSHAIIRSPSGFAGRPGHLRRLDSHAEGSRGRYGR